MSDWGIFMALEESTRLKLLKDKFKTAKDLGKKHCVKCGFCCYRRTCIPTPKELEVIAVFLRLSVKKTIEKYYCVDKRNFSDIYHIKPAGINQLDLLGKYITYDRTYNEGKCIFLDKNNLCKIYPVRPNSAKVAKCWNEDNEREENSLRESLESWDNGKLEKIYPEYLDTIDNK